MTNLELFLCLVFIEYFYLKKNLYLFFAVLAFSSCSELGLLSSLRCTGFSLWWLLLVWSTGSRVRAQ